MFRTIFVTTLIIIIYVFSEIFLRHVHLRWTFNFLSVFHFFFFHFSKKKNVHRKCPYLKKISEKLYIMIVKVVKNTILNNFVIHYMVSPWGFLNRLFISTCVSQVARFLKQAMFQKPDHFWYASWNGWSLKKGLKKHHTMYYKVVHNCILNNFHYHYIQFFRDFFNTCAQALTFCFFLRNEKKNRKKLTKKTYAFFIMKY